MSDPVDALVLDLLEWVGPGARPYAEVIEAWRTSCPRLPVWEEANARGYLQREHAAGTTASIRLTPEGIAALARQRPAARRAVAAANREPSSPTPGV
jgi:hypothetical protein